MPLPNETQALNLPAGWTCWLELKNDDGMCSGKAELREGRETRCVLVLAQKPTREEVLSRLQQRADHFIEEWQPRIATDSARFSARPRE